MPAKNYAATRYSALDEINGANVSNLQVAFAFSTGVDHGQEAAPIVSNNTMFIVTPYPNIVFALDLTKPGAPIKWSYQPHPAAAAQGVACCDVVNRGGTYSDGKLFFNTLDDNTIALDAETGKELWKTKLGDINTGETITMAPLVVKGKVLVGGARCRDRSDPVAGLRNGAGQGRANRPRIPLVLPFGQRQGPRRHDLAGRRVADRRRNDVGMDRLRS